MNILLYGAGQRLFYELANVDYYFQCMRQNSINIVGILDGNEEKVGKEIVLNKGKYIVHRKEEWNKYEFQYLVITSQKYYDEISMELIKSGVQKYKIISLQHFLAPYNDQLFHTQLYQNKLGIEIGGPSELFSNIYSVCKSCDGVNYSDRTVWWEGQDAYQYNEKILGKVCICDATDMSIVPDSNYDFLLSSNNLEHIANPIKALKEFQRVVKPGGYMLIIVPNKKYTFDHNRTFTNFKHILCDFESNVQENDLTHLTEIIEKHDYDMDRACGGKENFIKRAEHNFTNRCLHHHVFGKECLKQMFDYIGVRVIESTEVGSNFIILGEK